MTAHQFRRPANALVVTTLSLTLILGFSALALDTGSMCAVKGELQRSADAAALAGAASLISDNMLKENYDPLPDIIDNLEGFAFYNQAGGMSLQINSGDIVIGNLVDPLDPYESIDTIVADYNAVQITVRRDGVMNGEVPTLFGSVLGVESVPLEASATAIIDDRFAGFANPEQMPGPLTPFSISRSYYEDQLLNGPDDWSWNAAADVAVNSSDGIREIWIYPEDNNSNGGGNNGGSGSGGGNFGTLNIGLNMQGNEDLGAQIVNGVTSEQLIDEVGTDVLMFNVNGQPNSYVMTGNPGLSGGITEYVEQRIGDVIAFFVHDGVIDNGSTAEFTIADIRFGRVLDINLTGNPKDKRLVVQPIIYSGGGVITDPGANSSGGTVFALQLTR